jgi:hypothetical protein
VEKRELSQTADNSMDMPQKTLKIKVTYATVIPQSVFIKRK